MRRLGVTAVLVAGATAAAVAGAPEAVRHDWRSRVQVELGPAQPTFVVYEPIFLRITETNRGEDLPAIPTMGRTAQLFVRVNDGPEAEAASDPGLIVCTFGGARIPRWRSGISRSWLLMLLAPDVAGTDLKERFRGAAPRTLTFRYELSLDGESTLSSQAVVKVLPPTMEDRALLERIGEPEHILYLYRATRPPTDAPGLQFVDAIAARFPTSSFAPYALLKAALLRGTDWLGPSEVDERTDHVAALQSATEVIERFPESAIAPQAAYLVAAMLVRLGRTKELARRAPELKRIVGDDLQHSICLRLRLEGKEGGCSGPIQ